VLAWLSILEKANRGVAVGAELVSGASLMLWPTTRDGNSVAGARARAVESIVREHWRVYGRNYYSRYDYEGVESAGAEAMMTRLRGRIASFAAHKASDAGYGESTGTNALPCSCRNSQRRRRRQQWWW